MRFIDGIEGKRPSLMQPTAESISPKELRKREILRFIDGIERKRSSLIQLVAESILFPKERWERDQWSNCQSVSNRPANHINV